MARFKSLKFVNARSNARMCSNHVKIILVICHNLTKIMVHNMKITFYSEDAGTSLI